jgi:hypothetical protein
MVCPERERVLDGPRYVLYNIGSVSFLTSQSYEICKCLIFGYFEVQ